MSNKHLLILVPLALFVLVGLLFGPVSTFLLNSYDLELATILLVISFVLPLHHKASRY